MGEFWGANPTSPSITHYFKSPVPFGQLSPVENPWVISNLASLENGSSSLSKNGFGPTIFGFWVGDSGAGIVGVDKGQFSLLEKMAGPDSVEPEHSFTITTATALNFSSS